MQGNQSLALTRFLPLLFIASVVFWPCRENKQKLHLSMRLPPGHFHVMETYLIQRASITWLQFIAYTKKLLSPDMIPNYFRKPTRNRKVRHHKIFYPQRRTPSLPKKIHYLTLISNHQRSLQICHLVYFLLDILILVCPSKFRCINFKLWRVRNVWPPVQKFFQNVQSIEKEHAPKIFQTMCWFGTV